MGPSTGKVLCDFALVPDEIRRSLLLPLFPPYRKLGVRDLANAIIGGLCEI